MLYIFAVFMAFAATFTHDVAVKIDHTKPTISGYEVEDVFSFGSQHDFSSVSADTTWSNLKCEINASGSMGVVFRAVESAWPTSWPTTTSCEVVYKGNTYKVNIALSACSGEDACKRVLFASTIPNCTATMTYALKKNEYRYETCWLPAPPSGTAYTNPTNAAKGAFIGMWWPGSLKIGTSEAPDTDPEVGAVQCAVQRRKVVATGAAKYLLKIRLTDSLPASDKLYCPIRKVNTSGNYSWATPVKLTVTR